MSKTRNAAPAPEPQDHEDACCPTCGRCRHCGRGPEQVRFIPVPQPYPVPYQPYVPYVPPVPTIYPPVITITSGGTVPTTVKTWPVYSESSTVQ